MINFVIKTKHAEQTFYQLDIYNLAQNNLALVEEFKHSN